MPHTFPRQSQCQHPPQTSFFKTCDITCSIFSSSPQSRHHFHHPGPARCMVRRLPCCSAKARGLVGSGLGAVLPRVACGTGRERLLLSPGRRRSVVGGPGGWKLGRAQLPAENTLKLYSPLTPHQPLTLTLTQCSLCQAQDPRACEEGSPCGCEYARGQLSLCLPTRQPAG